MSGTRTASAWRSAGSFCAAAGRVALALAALASAAPAPAAPAPGDARRAAAIRRACEVQALPASECAGQGPQSTPSGPGAQDAAAVQAGPRTFTDPRGRYRFATPPGWELKLQGDTPTLSNGQAWIAVVATDGATPQAAAQSVGGQFQPAFSRIDLASQGPARFGGHDGFGISANGVSRAKGEQMSVLVLAVSAGSGHDLVLVSAVPVERAQALNGGVIAMANSARFQGE